MDPTTRISLVKILPQQYAEDFLSGNLYLNAAVYFSKIDSDAERYDCDEAAAAAWQTQKMEIWNEASAEWLEIKGVQNPAIYRDGSFDDLNVLCVYAMTDREGHSFDTRNYGFGDTAIFIRDLVEFVKRVKAAAASQGKSVRLGPITYMDRSTYHGSMGPFRKFAVLRHQNEFRFVLSGGNGEACRLTIGDVRDIAFAAPSAEIPVQWDLLRSFGTQ